MSLGSKGRVRENEAMWGSTRDSNMASESAERREIRIVPYFEHQQVQEYIIHEKTGVGKKEKQRGYQYFCESYVIGIKTSMYSDSGEGGCRVTGSCYRSQSKSDPPHKMQVFIFEQAGRVVFKWAKCSCAIGLGGRCGHLCGLLYQLAHFKMMKAEFVPEDITKTDKPQTWHIPRGPRICAISTDDAVVRSARNQDTEVKPVTSTLYNPIVTPLPPVGTFVDKLSTKTTSMLPTVFNASAHMQKTKFGNFPKGSPLAYQQHDVLIELTNINVAGISFPPLPASDTIGENDFSTVLNAEQQETFLSLCVSAQEVAELEQATQNQGNDPKWHRLRLHRLTASKIAEVSKAMDTYHKAVRKEEELDPKTLQKPAGLACRLKSSNHRTTKAMRDGLANEPKAAEAYVQKKNQEVNIYPAGIVIHPRAFWLAATPDRKVYDPNDESSFGLLEVKCPDMSRKQSLDDLDYLVKRGDQYFLKTSHTYYYQVQMQMAVTGLPWTDFYVWSEKVTHLERIEFNEQFWAHVKSNADKFYFTFFL